MISEYDWYISYLKFLRETNTIEKKYKVGDKGK
jgi:hypothetical protein